METILSLNSGQHILFGFALTSLQGKTNHIFTLEAKIKLAELVKELTDEELYEDVLYCPDVTIMTEPQNAYKIFNDWFEENEIYFEHFYQQSNFDVSLSYGN